MSKVLRYFIKFQATMKELTKGEFEKLYDLMKVRMTTEERDALQRACAPGSKNDTVTIMFDPTDEEGYRNTILKILE